MRARRISGRAAESNRTGRQFRRAALRQTYRSEACKARGGSKETLAADVMEKIALPERTARAAPFNLSAGEDEIRCRVSRCQYSTWYAYDAPAKAVEVSASYLVLVVNAKSTLLLYRGVVRCNALGHDQEVEFRVGLILRGPSGQFKERGARLLSPRLRSKIVYHEVCAFQRGPTLQRSALR